MEFFTRPVVCNSCNQEFTKATGTLTFEEEGLRITVGNVPLLRCVSCGEEFVPGPIAEEISEIVNELAMELREAPLSSTEVQTQFVDRTLQQPLAV